jgi:hypothetical protein
MSVILFTTTTRDEILSAMFSLAGSDGLVRIALGAGLGAVAGAAIQALIRRRRLRRLGFTSADLSSRETFFKKLAEITVQKMPEKISLTQLDSYSWSKPSEYKQARAALEKLGLERNPAFVASPQKWVVEFWLSKDDGIFAAILDSPPCGIHTEFMVSYEDGSTVSFENTEECGRRHLENHNWIHCGTVRPDQLLERASKERRPDHAGQMQLDDCVQAYERATNESLAWRRRIGLSPAEMKHTYERLRRKRSLSGRLS